MRIYSNLIQKIGTFLPKVFMTVGVLSLLLLPLVANAKEVIIWELDNWFSVEGGASPDGPRTEFDIAKGDTVKFINMGATDHDAGNQLFITDDGQTLFDKELFGSSAQSAGETFTTDPINLVGEIPFICFIHGEEDMAGTLNVTEDGEPIPGPTPDPGKLFTFECEHKFGTGPVGLELLTMEVGDTEACTLKLTNFEPGRSVEVIVSTIPRSNKSPITIDMPDGNMTDENGELRVNIMSTGEGFAWFACSIVKGRSFSLRHYRQGAAWGAFVNAE